MAFVSLEIETVPSMPMDSLQLAAQLSSFLEYEIDPGYLTNEPNNPNQDAIDSDNIIQESWHNENQDSGN